MDEQTGWLNDLLDRFDNVLQDRFDTLFENDLHRSETLFETLAQQRAAFFQKQSDAFEALFGDKNNQAVDTNDGDQEDTNVKNKQEVKKADGQEIENVKDEERKNVEDHQVFEGNDNTNNDDIGYIEDELGFLAHKINYPNDNDARDQASELETKVLEDGKQDDVKVVGVTDEPNNDEPKVLEGNGVIGVGENEINKWVDKEVQYVVSTLHFFIPLLKRFNDKHIKKKKMKKMLKEETSQCTVITIAHRIPTIGYSGLVLVLDQGKVVEYDSPTRLQSNGSSAFSKLVNEFLSRSVA
ncbi:putative ABC transporter C family member 15 [Tanacetum coccineum]